MPVFFSIGRDFFPINVSDIINIAITNIIQKYLKRKRTDKERRQLNLNWKIRELASEFAVDGMSL